MRRIQRQRTKGWRMPEGAVYVGRPSLWGNPYSLDDIRVIYPDVPPDQRAAVAVRLYREELTHWGLLHDYGWCVSDAEWNRTDRLIRWTGARNMGEYAAIALRGHDLACWCPLTDADGNRVPCHADVLLEMLAVRP